MKPMVVRGIVSSVDVACDDHEQVTVRFDSKEIRERFNSGAFYLVFPNQGLKLRDEIEIEIRLVPVVIPQAEPVPGIEEPSATEPVAAEAA